MTADVTRGERHDEAQVLPGGADDTSLRAAVAASRSWRGVLRSFELTAPRYARRLQLACDQWGID